MVSVYENACSRLEIAYMKQTSAVFILADDEHIRRTEAGRSNVAVIDSLLDKRQRFTAVLFHLFDD